MTAAPRKKRAKSLLKGVPIPPIVVERVKRERRATTTGGGAPPPPKVKDVGVFIRDYLLSHGEDYISRIHKAYKSEHRERKKAQKKEKIKGWWHRVATYHSFLTYCSKLVLIGLLERSGTVDGWESPLAGSKQHVYLRLSSKGVAAPDYVWERPLRLWYNPKGEEIKLHPNYVGTTTAKLVTKPRPIKKVRPKPSVRPAAPREPTVPVVTPTPTAKPSVGKLVDKWTRVERGDPVEALKDVALLAPYYDVSPCVDALEDYQKINPQKNPKGSNDAWGRFLNCLRLLEKEEMKEEKKKGKVKPKRPSKAVPLPPTEPSIIQVVELLRAVPMDEKKKAKSIDKLEAEIEDLTTEQRELIAGLEDVETAIEDYREVSREGMTPEEYVEEKESAWEDIIEALDAIEPVEEGE